MCKYAHILIAVLLASSIAQAQSPDIALKNRKRALELELQYIRDHPGGFYLLIDLSIGEIHLKADANLLRVCKIHTIAGVAPRETEYAQFLKRLDPLTSEPGNDRLRHRSRLLPLDFVGRLTEGPRRRSQLYFTPPLLLKPPDIPHTSAALLTLVLDASDIKTLGAAMQPLQAAIVIPPDKIP